MSISKKTINSSDLKLSPPSFLFNSEHQRALLQFINEKIVSHSVPEVNSVTIMAKIVWGQTEPMALIDIEQCQKALETSLCEKLATYSNSGPQETPKTAN